jgi:chemosensory pili system protein ChpA (sensor histidine kinase/response regulator)
VDESRPDDDTLLERFRSASLRRPEGLLPPPGDDRLGAPGMTPAVPAPMGAEFPSPIDLERVPSEVEPMFLVETRDDLHDLRHALLQVEQHQNEAAALREMGRITHKIKGAAATLEYVDLAGLAHTFEEMLLIVYQRQPPATAQAVTLLERGLRLLEACLTATENETSPDPVLHIEVTRLVEDLRAGEPAASTIETSGDGLKMGPGTEGDTTPLPARKSEGGSYLRVDVRRLDVLMSHVSSLATNRAVLTRMREDLAHFHQELDSALVRLKNATAQIGDWQPLMQAWAVHPAGRNGERQVGDPASHALPRPMLPTKTSAGRPGSSGSALAKPATLPATERLGDLDEVLQTLAESTNDVAASSASLRSMLQRFSQSAEALHALMAQMQRDMTAIRLVPLHDLVPRLQFGARQVASDRQKLVTFSVRGEMTQVDRDISEALAEPLMQLVRNAIVHGLETPEERRESGKPERGTVWLHAYYVGDQVTIEVGDDGCGINPSLLVAAAIAAGMLEPEAGRALSEAEALSLMFTPGISTIEEAHVSGGRGIGLDEVRTVVERLKGTIEVTSELGQGTVFRICVPISLSVLKVLHVSVADGAYALPFSSVQHTLTLSAAELVSVDPPPTTHRDGGHIGPNRRARVASERIHIGVEPLSERGVVEEMPAVALAELLGDEYHARDPQPALVLDIGQRPVALLIDSVFGEHEVVVHALPTYLRRRGVHGATVTLDGQVLLLLDLAELVGGVLEGRRTLPPVRPAPRFARAEAPRVLVVDDSVSMRTALASMLSHAGYDVHVARDGFDALGLLLESLPQAIILDLEMPRLDGFELLKVLRGAPQFAGVRIVVLTSKASERHREQARALGADEYLIKPCPDSILLATIQRMLGAPPSS